MCWCRPEIRTPFCGRPECRPPGEPIDMPRLVPVEAVHAPDPAAVAVHALCLMDTEAVIEGGLHVEATVDLLLAVKKQLPTVKSRKLGCIWTVSGSNTPEVMARLAVEQGRMQADEALTHANVTIAIADAELQAATDVGLEHMLRSRALEALAQLKDYSPGCTEIHWIGPMRGCVR